MEGRAAGWSPSSALLHHVLGRIETADPKEAAALSRFSIDAAGGSATTARINLLSLPGFVPSGWHRYVLPSVAWFVRVFGERPRYGRRLVLDALAPYWNGYDDPLMGTHVWAWTRTSLAPYFRCQSAVDRTAAHVPADYGAWADTGRCWHLLLRLATVRGYGGG